MLLVVYGGVAITNSIPFVAQYTELIRKIFGVLMIFAALAIAFHFDVVLQQLAIRYFPAIRLEESSLVQKELEKLRTGTSSTSVVPAVGKKAPEFIGITAWINSPALSIEQLKGKVVLVDFWTYSCINCVRTLPYLKQWYASYQDKGLVLVGIHTPEFEFEKNSANVKDAVKRFGIEYPVCLDNNFKTWQNYHNRFWPAHYLIDQEGIIRYIHFGEGNYVETENAIRALLQLPALDKKERREPIKAQTPETYLGYERGASYRDALKKNESAAYDYQGPLVDDKVGLQGEWLATSQYIQSKSDKARLDLNFIASHVYCVMEAKQESPITVLLDGKPLATNYYGKDSNKQGQVVVKESRMYEILDLKADSGRHTLTLEVPAGVALYAFTFGA
jgi:thiol-disulfide isomerase/thioredoxin